MKTLIGTPSKGKSLAVSPHSYRVVVFVSENDTQQKNFNDYIQYFQEKDRMGMVYLKSGLMFLVPPSPASLKYFNED